MVGSQLSANRFSALGDDPEVEDEASGGEESQDTEIDLRGSDVQVEEVVEATVDSNPIPMEPRVHALPGAFASLE